MAARGRIPEVSTMACRARVGRSGRGEAQMTATVRTASCPSRPIGVTGQAQSASRKSCVSLTEGVICWKGCLASAPGRSGA